MAKKDKTETRPPAVTGPLAFFAVVLGSATFGVVTGGVTGIIAGLILRDELFGFGALAGAMGGMLVGYPLGIIPGNLLLKKMAQAGRFGPAQYSVRTCGRGVTAIVEPAVKCKCPDFTDSVFYFHAGAGSGGIFPGTETKQLSNQQSAISGLRFTVISLQWAVYGCFLGHANKSILFLQNTYYAMVPVEYILRRKSPPVRD